MKRAQRPAAELRRTDRSRRPLRDTDYHKRTDLGAAQRRQLQRRVGPHGLVHGSTFALGFPYPTVILCAIS